MPIKDLKNWLPKPEQILKNRSLKFFAPHLSDARLWHFNRRYLSKAVYIGIMSSYFPLPGQMFIALVLCLYFRANVPMAVALTWVTNPITTIPIYYFAYWLGAVILNKPMITLDIIKQMLSNISNWIFKDGENPLALADGTVSLSTFMIGLFILAIVSSVLAGVAFNLIWRYKTVAMWRKRSGYRTPENLIQIKETKK